MAEHLFQLPIFAAESLGTSATLTSAGIDQRRISRIESLLIQVTSVAGAADVRVEYAISQDDSTYGSSNDYDDIVESSNTDFVTPEGITVVSMPAILAPFFQIEVDELTASLSDTLVTAWIIAME